MNVTKLRLGLPGPQSSAEVCDADSIAGMRQAIFRGARESRLIRECLEAAESRRLVRDEFYVLLAYEALLRLEELQGAFEQLRDTSHAQPVTLDAIDGHI